MGLWVNDALRATPSASILKKKLANWANRKFEIRELGDLKFKLANWANHLFQTCQMSTEGARGS